MLGWMDDEALHRTLTTGRATYWSRSRHEYWVKGETSGHVQQVREVRLDCDGDTLLLQVDQSGVACHTGDRTCFDAGLLRPSCRCLTRGAASPPLSSRGSAEAVWPPSAGSPRLVRGRTRRARRHGLGAVRARRRFRCRRVPLAGALALVALAAWGVLLVTRGRVRRVMAALAALASLGVLVAVVVGCRDAAGPASRDELRAVGASSVGVGLTAGSGPPPPVACCRLAAAVAGRAGRAVVARDGPPLRRARRRARDRRCRPRARPATSTCGRRSTRAATPRTDPPTCLSSDRPPRMAPADRTTARTRSSACQTTTATPRQPGPPS